MHIYLKQKVFAIGDKYNFTDESQQVLFQGKKPAFSLLRMYLNDPEGKELYFVKRKLLSFMPCYRIMKNEEVLYTIKQKFGFRNNFVITDNEGNELRIQGSFYAYDFTLFLADKFIGAINKKIFSFGDAYDLNIADDFDPALFCTIAMVIDNCLHNGGNKSGFAN